MLKKFTTPLVSLSGNSLNVLGEIEFEIKNVGVVSFVVIDKMSHEIIIGIDQLHVHGFYLDSKVLVWGGRIFDLLEKSNDNDSKVDSVNNMVHDTLTLTKRSSDNWLSNLLAEYSDLFQEGQLPSANLPAMEINTLPGRVVSKKPYRTPLAKREVVEREIDKMLKAGVIRPSASNWSSPITLVPKPDGSTRFCCDFRAVNDVTIKDRYPLPLIQDIFDTLKGAKVFSTLDLRSGYWQLPVHPNSIHKTSFVCHAGQYEWLRMPFGLSNAPGVFQRCMNQILSDFIGRFCLVYLDDVVIFSKDLESHQDHIRQIFDKFRLAGLTLNERKCHFNEPSLRLLGYIVSADGIAARPEKTKAISDMPPPETLTEIRSFLGMTSYYRQLVPRFAEIAEPLYELTRKNVHWHWDEPQQTAFESLKAALVSSEVMAYPDTSKPYILMTDACNYAVGAILLQEDDDGVERPIQYLSQQLTATQRKYATIEKEALAVIIALKKFRAYLWGSDFVIYTDHKPLLSLFKGEMANTKIQRWAVLLAEFGAPIKHCPGRRNVRADLLSRIRDPNETALVDADSEWVTAEQVKEHLPPLVPVLADELCMDTLLMAQIAEFQEEREAAREEDSRFTLIDNILYSISRPKHDLPQYPRLILPIQFRDQVITRCHTDVGHQSLLKTMARVQESYVWSGMKSDVKQWLDKCGLCQVHTKRAEKVPMGEMPIARAPGIYIGIDLIGPLVPSRYSEARYIMTTIDHHDGWAEAYVLKRKTNEAVWERLRNDFIPRFSAPECIITDQGSEFKGGDFHDWLKGMGIEHRRTTPYHPQSNGRVERFNGTLKRILKKLVNGDRADWEDQLGTAITAYRISTSTVTGRSPFMLRYVHPPRYPLTRLMADDHSRSFENRLEMHANLMQEAARATEDSRTHNRNRLARQANAKEIKAGDKVIIKAREPLSLTAQWDYGFIVTKVNGKVLTIFHPTTGVTQIINREQVRLVDPDIAWDHVHPRPRRQQVPARVRMGRRPQDVPAPEDNRPASPPPAPPAQPVPWPIPQAPPPPNDNAEPARPPAPIPRLLIKRRAPDGDSQEPEAGYHLRHKRHRWTAEQIAYLHRRRK